MYLIMYSLICSKGIPDTLIVLPVTHCNMAVFVTRTCRLGSKDRNLLVLRFIGQGWIPHKTAKSVKTNYTDFFLAKNYRGKWGKMGHMKSRSQTL